MTATSGKQTATQTLTITPLVAMDKINYDGYAWQVLKIENGQAMLVTETVQGITKFNPSEADGNAYKGSTLEKEMTSFYSGKLTKMKQYALPVNLPAVGTEDDDTTDKTTVASSGTATAFALSTADVLTTWKTEAERIGKDADGTAQNWWLRSPNAYSYNARNVGSTGGVINFYVAHEGSVRPAVYVNLTSEVFEEWSIEGVDEVEQDSTHQLTTTEKDVNYVWSVSGNKDTKTTMGLAGKLTVGADETATELTVSATDGTRTAIKTIKVVAVKNYTHSR